MPKKCLVDINVIFIFYLGGRCITSHGSFDPVVLLKNTLWTALVGLHDRENSWLPGRDNVPNK